MDSKVILVLEDACHGKAVTTSRVYSVVGLFQDCRLAHRAGYYFIGVDDNSAPIRITKKMMRENFAEEFGNTKFYQDFMADCWRQ